MSVKDLTRLGQSVWLDYIRRHLLRSGEFAALLRDDGVSGVTSNPSIFEKAIAGSTDYDEAIAGHASRSAAEIYERIAVEDIQAAADQLRPIYDGTHGADGFACLEVSPLLAHDTAGTLDEARRLWKRLGRENVMIKVPATREGIPAIRQLVSEGINVNVTLLFSRDVYAEVAEAHLAGLEMLRSNGGDPGSVAGVASFFVSRIDVAVDALLEERRASAIPGSERSVGDLLGSVAIANARLAYQDWKAYTRTPRWLVLAKAGARPQRLLWASTSTKDPRLSDVLYVESLIGPESVDTIPPATLDAFRDHGRARLSLDEDLDGARAVIDALPALGISLRDVTDRLLVEGVQQFRVAFEGLLAAIEKKRADALHRSTVRVQRALPAPLEAGVDAALTDWERQGKVRRLWARDATLWTGRDEAKWLDWLRIAEFERGDESNLLAFAAEVRRRGLTHVTLLGMGGSSLFPDVLARTFSQKAGYPRLATLDSTDPSQIAAFEAGLDLTTTLFVVSSKSGTTLEPNLLDDYFYARMCRVVGEAEAGRHFVVITDPSSPHLQEVADQRRYWRVFHGELGIGGRYSALSRFGMVPAATMGLDVGAILERTVGMAHACAACVPARDNPGVVLGAVLGTLANAGRDKVTLVVSPGIVAFGGWLEQLLAESTGKQGRGIIPIDREPLGAPATYGQDRLFAYVRLDDAPDPAQDEAIVALTKVGHPVVTVSLPSTEDLGQACFLWEFATAVAGSIIGIHPFDQPDVEASKAEARRLMGVHERTGTLAVETPFHSEGPIALYADDMNQSVLTRAASGDPTVRGYLRAHLERLNAGDYFAILAWLAREEPHRLALDGMRRDVRDQRGVATCLGFGPRFLHSTGQAYKGGPDTGVFLQLTHDATRDLQIPGKPYTFGVVEAAQARADLHVLGQRNRRALRVHLGRDVDAGLRALSMLMREALAHPEPA